MAQAGRAFLLAELRRRIAHLATGGRATATGQATAASDAAAGPAAARRGALPFGLHALDARLPDGGLRLGALHEVMEAGAGSEHAANAVLFAAGVLARLDGPVLWCLRGRDLFAPALARVGLHPDRVVYCETWKDAEVLPAMEEGLRHKGLAGVVGEVFKLGLTPSRRLQLAAEASGVTALVVRRRRAHAEGAPEPTAALTRWQVSASPSPALSAPGLARPRWLVELIRCRGADPHSWLLEACDAKGRLACPAELADRPAAQDERRRAAAG